MSLSALAFNKGKAAERLAFVSQNIRVGARATMLVQTVLLVLAALLAAKTFLVDYPAAPRFLEPTTIMGLEASGALSLLATLYWLMSGLHLRVTQCRRWQVDVSFGGLVVIVGAVLFSFGMSHRFTNVYSNYVYADLCWFCLGFLAACFLPWASAAHYVWKFKRPLRFFVFAGLVLRLLAFAAFVCALLFFNGRKVYDNNVTKDILAAAGFGSALQGFVTILWCLLLLLAFGAVVCIMTLLTVGWDALSKSTFRADRTLLYSVFVTGLVSFAYLLDYAGTVKGGPLVWLVLAVTIGLALGFLAANLLLRVSAMPALMRTLTVCLELLVVIIASFGLQYFVSAADSDRSFAYLLTMPALLLLAAHLFLTRVAAHRGSQAPLVMVLSAAGSSALSYHFLVAHGFADLLPGEIPAKTLFNFILIGAVLFTAIYACCRLFLATNAATRLLALRSGAVQGVSS